MKRISAICFLVCIAQALLAQSFEGKIIYQNTYRNKKSNNENFLLDSMMGTVQNYYIREGNYKSVTNGNLVQWQLYINSNNKLYNKYAGIEALLWNDGIENKDSVLRAEIHRNVIRVLGFDCDELILHCKSGDQKYYFIKALAVDAELYKNHHFGNWYEVISRTGALPLKSIQTSTSFITESVAAEIIPMKLPDDFFILPGNLPVRKNLF